jgi:sensor histidine kinase YesM
LFYAHFNLLSKYVTGTRPQYIKLAVLVMVENIIFLIIKGVWDYFSVLHVKTGPEQWHNLERIIGMDFYRNLYYIFLSSVIWSGIHFGKFQRRTTEEAYKRLKAEQANKELQYKFAQAQNAFLKQQINPHLLFNTLNTIYSTVYRSSPENSEAVLLLSEIMRYSFEEAGPDGRVPLDKELSQLQNLIKLNAYRVDRAFTVDYVFSGDPSLYTIIPLVLITLTENMFKHGDLRFPPRSVSIAIDDKGQMNFTTRNVPKLVRQSNTNTSIGLANTRLRLDYAYPNNYTLDLSETDELFQLELTINLKS